MVPWLAGLFHQTLRVAHEEIQSAAQAVLGWNSKQGTFQQLNKVALFKEVLMAFDIPPELLHQGTSSANREQAGAATRQPAASTQGLPGPVSLASLGAEEAEMIAGSSCLQDQARLGAERVRVAPTGAPTQGVWLGQGGGLGGTGTLVIKCTH